MDLTRLLENALLGMLFATVCAFIMIIDPKPIFFFTKPRDWYIFTAISFNMFFNLTDLYRDY